MQKMSSRAANQKNRRKRPDWRRSRVKASVIRREMRVDNREGVAAVAPAWTSG